MLKINNFTIVELEKEFFIKNPNDDYASFIVQNRNILLSNLQKDSRSPINNSCIQLSNNDNIDLWFAPAGNLPLNPELIILGQATSIPALEYQINSDIFTKSEYLIRKILINSSYFGTMLSNLGCILKYLNFDSINSFNFQKEWSNINNCYLGSGHSPEGNLFSGNRNSKIMFSQFCMHCATTYKKDKKTYSTSSSNLKKYINLNNSTFNDLHNNILTKKFFFSKAKLLIVLSEALFKYLKNQYFKNYSNTSWIDYKSNHSYNKMNKIITWIPHPSPGNTFYNKSKTKNGVFSSIFYSDISNKNYDIDEICMDYPKNKNQANQVIFLKSFFNDFSV